MPKGTRHKLTGILRWTKKGYALEMDGGGLWRLDICGRTRRFIDKPVVVEGIRSGFDLIDVDKISLLEAEPPVKSLWRRLSERLMNSRNARQ